MFLNTICTFVVVLMVCHVEKGGAQLPSFTTDLSPSTGCIPLEEGTPISFNLIRSGGAFGPSFTIETLDDSATFPADYTLPMGTAGTFTVSPNFQIVIDPVDDGITEGEESFTLRFSAIGYTPLDVLFCISDPPTTTIPPAVTTIPPEVTTIPTTNAPLAFSANARTCVKESLTPLVIRIRRPSSDTLAMNASVTYSDVDADSTSDYVDSVTTLTFQDGKRNAYLEVPITDDLVVESTEEFSITISAPGYDPITIKGCIKDDDRTVPFNCNRYGVTCDAGTCLPSGSTCDCSTAPDRTGDNCGIIQSNINGTGCAGTDCGRKGRCVSDGSVGACVCNSGYYSGDEGKCELKRTTITSCNNNKMTICMNPINTYRPLITVSGYTSNRCTADLVGNITDNQNRIPSDIQGQCLTVGFSGTCGTYNATSQDGNVCYTIPYRIQYNPNMMTATDEVVYAKCCVNQAGQTISTDAILADTATDNINKQQETLNFLGVKLSPTLNNGRPIDSPLPLNQIYQLCLDITDEGFAYIGLIRIIVHNGQRGSSRKEAVVYGNDGCSDESGKAIVHSYPRRVSDTRICMRYRPGYFRPGPAAVIHDMKYRLCLAGDQASCQLTQCGATGRRKKRQTNTGGVEATANHTVYFEDESTSASQTNTETEVSPTAQNCLLEMSVIFPAIIVVCVVTLLLIIVIMYMCFLLMKKRRKQEDKQDDLKSEKSHKHYPYGY
ncbi:EGF-like domain-containing protein 2 [Haliotis rubra]|uniref:EGF-like domain-containing protein 2 n=1 Tax=Haliotis rubra TaxID=36100 RepID=UPI001EE5C35E|nr:EGF-like domain-containing protein 2 [Haliotis rubra]